MPEAAHALDHVVWQALTTRQRHLAEGGPLARRFPADIAPFAATLDDTPASDQALRALLSPCDPVAPGERVALVTPTELAPKPGLTIVRNELIDQMVFQGRPPAPPARALLPLQAADIPAMLALAQATQPGPFGVRTTETGAYIGLEVDGELVAMAGERMKLAHFTEVSAVCVAPSHRGQGLAADLVNAVTAAILAAGDTPFLHVFAANTAAIALYRKLGFVRRRQLHLTAFRLPN